MSNSVESGRGMRRRSLLAATVLGSIGMISITPTPAFAFSGDNYPEPWRSASLGAYIDDWGYYTRYCTSWVAWALHDRNGFEMPRAIGDASNWGHWASSNGFPVNSNPAVGSVAWWSSNHVAWVEAVNGDQIIIQEYNYGYTGSYNRRTISKSNPTGYIHFQDIATPPASGWGGVGNASFVGTDTLSASQELHANQYMLSSNGLFVLMMQSDGNLVIYRSNGAIWASNTAGNPGAYLRVQPDGNLVIYKTKGGAAIWATGMKSIAKLTMQGDGNLVGRSSSGAAMWATNTVRNTHNYTLQGSQLEVGGSLLTYKFLRSPDKRYFALMQNDGNLVVYGPGYRALWASGTSGNSSAYLTAQSDGNAVIYQTVHGAVLWATGKKSIVKLVMQSDGNFVAYNASSQPVWATDTAARL